MLLDASSFAKVHTCNLSQCSVFIKRLRNEKIVGLSPAKARQLTRDT
jgi:hypothetical protein